MLSPHLPYRLAGKHCENVFRIVRSAAWRSCYVQSLAGVITRNFSIMTTSKLILSTALLFALAGPAFAEDQPSGGGHIRQACAADFQKFCADAQDRDARHQ